MAENTISIVRKGGKVEEVPVPAYVYKNPPLLESNAEKVFRARYLRKDPTTGEPIETIPEAFFRVAHVVSKGDARKAEVYYRVLRNLLFLPNSPTWTGAGTPLGQLAACFVLPVEDSMESIMQTLKDAALIQKTGGGNGFDFSRIRPKGSPISTSSGMATGPIGFMRMYDAAFGEIRQGGTRRGANMAVLRVDHPDIQEFIRCKSVEGDLSNFNISVGITDQFMEAVQSNRMHSLVHPSTGQVVRELPARDLWDEITESAARNGEPGVLFLDTINADNSVPHLYRFEATNPCGEQPLGPYESCCLGSINLSKFVRYDTDFGPTVAWQNLHETVTVAVEFLNDVIDVNHFVDEVPQLAEQAKRTRRIGLGITGLADMLIKLRIPYGSEESLSLVKELMASIRAEAVETSGRLATETSPLPALAGGPMGSNASSSLDNAWQVLEDKRKADGLRGFTLAYRPQANAALLTIAPTGTLSTVAGCEGYGCEPLFALAHQRTLKQGNEGLDEKLWYVSKLLEEVLDGLEKEGNLDHQAKEAILEHVKRTGTLSDMEVLHHVDPAVMKDLQKVFAVSGDIGVEEHIRMQAALQRYVDSAVSKTINLPAGSGSERVSEAFTLAWEEHCKGCTVYVTGSREEVVLETRVELERKAAIAAAKLGEAIPDPSQGSDVPMLSLLDPRANPFPDDLVGKTGRIQTPLGKAYVTLNHLAGGEPSEVFVNVGRAGSNTAAVSEAIGRLCSLILQLDSPTSPQARLEAIVGQLEGLGSSRSIGFGANRVSSLPDGLAQVLRRLSSDRVEVSFPAAAAQTDLCPKCGGGNLRHIEGCQTCPDCGYSAC